MYTNRTYVPYSPYGLFTLVTIGSNFRSISFANKLQKWMYRRSTVVVIIMMMGLSVQLILGVFYQEQFIHSFSFYEWVIRYILLLTTALTFIIYKPLQSYIKSIFRKDSIQVKLSLMRWGLSKGINFVWWTTS